MRVGLLCFALLSGVDAHLAADGPVVLPALSARPASAPAKLMVIVPSWGPPEAYEAMARQVQASSSLRLTIGIVRCNSPIPGVKYVCDAEYGIFKLLPEVISLANASAGGSLKPGDVFIGGHGVGGAISRRFVDKAYPQSAGVFFLGTQYNGDSDSMMGYLGYPVKPAAYPRPFLALAGELDKMPISHLALMISHMSNMSDDEKLQKYASILPGLDQSSFLSDPYHVSDDVVAEVDRATAQQVAGKVIGAWLDFVSGNGSGPKKVLSEALTTTLKIAQPFIDAVAEDGKWCVASQRQIPGVPSDAEISIRNVPFSKLDSCHTTYSKTAAGKLELSLCDYSSYNYGHRPPWDPSYAGAQDISCKMIGEDRIAQLMKLPAPDMNASSVKNYCQKINLEAFAKAKEIVNKSWPKALSRFNEQGKKVVLDADTSTSIGPLWLLTGLKFKEAPKDIDISGVNLISGIKSFIYPGNHYCKLLSPSIAVEIIMTMALTKRIPQDEVTQFVV